MREVMRMDGFSPKERHHVYHFSFITTLEVVNVGVTSLILQIVKV